MSGRLELRLPNELAVIARIAERIERFGAEQDLPADVVNALNVVLDEAVNNIVRHGYGAGVRGEILVRLERRQHCIVVEVEDQGRAFDPATAAPPDLSPPPLERPIGGLGVHFIRTLMDEVSYARKDGTNILRLVKNVGTG